MATVQGSKWTPGGLVRARSRDWVVLPPDEPDVVRLRPVDGSDSEAVEYISHLSQKPLNHPNTKYPIPIWLETSLVRSCSVTPYASV